MSETVQTPFHAATEYTRRGWRVVPIPYRSKNPGIRGWQTLRIDESELRRHFNGRPQNIGVLLGEPSGWLIDVDLDHLRAVDLAADFLPLTPAIFGRAGKPRSHWLYHVSAPVKTKKFRSRSAGMVVELRSTGAQTVVPPSTHESGEAILWEDEAAEPAVVPPGELLSAVEQLATAVLVDLGEPTRPRSIPASSPAPSSAEASVDLNDRAQHCLAAMLRMTVADSNDGSRRLFAAACRAVEHDLTDPAALATIRRYADQRPFPREWSDENILERVRDAEKKCIRGAGLDVDKGATIPLGTRDPQSGRLVLSPTQTLPTAEAYIREFHSHPGGRTLHSQAGMLLTWRDNRFVELEEPAIKHSLQGWLHEAQRYVRTPKNGEMTLAAFASNPGTVRAALETIHNFVHLPATLTAPVWLNGGSSRPSASEILPCRSCLLHLSTMERLDPTPSFFTTTALDFDWEPQAPEPRAWSRFLHELFDDDNQSHELLQEWAGHCLTAGTSLQKMLLIVGPRRSGKGTVARVLTRLMGTSNVCGPTTSSLGGQFGLQPLIGKSLAIISDARFTGENIPTVVERLLCITGEDMLTIDRKHLPCVTMKLPTRFMFLTNELPRLNDSSGALAGRFVILRTQKSFYGKEDTTLTKKLVEELPGILNWAIEGWRRLRDRGRFVMPQSVEDAVRDLEDLSSPVGAFVRDQCVVEPGRRVWVDDLYAAWRRWCEDQGRTAMSTKQSFGRDLAAAVTGVACRRGSGNVRFYEGISLKEGSQ